MKSRLHILICLALVLVLALSQGILPGKSQGIESGVAATFATTPISIDGFATADEWSPAQVLTFTNFKVRFKNDATYLYLLLDVINDTGDDPLGATEFCAILIDVDRDGTKTQDVDLYYGINDNTGSFVLKKEVSKGAGWTGMQPTYSYGTIGFGPSPDSSIPHRFYEIAFRYSEISGKPGFPTNMGFSVRSTTPDFFEKQPSNLSTDFTGFSILNSASPQVAYLYDSTSTSGNTDAVDFQSMLYQTSGYWATLVPLNQVAMVDFSPYQSIVVGTDTANDTSWLGSDAALAKIRLAKKPIIGVGKGGGKLFDALDLDIGAKHSWGATMHNIGIMDAAHYAWMTPLPINTYSPFQVYTVGVSANGVYLPSPLPGVVRLGEDLTDTTTRSHFTVIAQQKDQVCFTTWGFFGRFVNLTSEGKEFLSNLVANPPCTPSVMILYGSSTTFAISLAKEVGNLIPKVFYIPAANTATTDLSQYSAVIITPDASAAWDTPANVEKLRQLHIPIMAMGIGGSKFLEKLGLTIGFSHTSSTASGNDGIVVNPLDRTTTHPYPIAFDSTYKDSLYTITPVLRSFYSGGFSNSRIKPIVHDPLTLGYDVIVSESQSGVCYTFWGYEGPPSGMTNLGKNLFKNLVFEPQCNWPAFLPAVMR